MLAPMRFKDYIWLNNPKTFEIEYQRKIIQHKVPFGGTISQNMGQNARIFKGEGEFAGRAAYAQFIMLSKVFAEDSPGVLSHPLWPSANVYFKKLVLMQEPQQDYVRYYFEFEECAEKTYNKDGLFTDSKFYSAKNGETLGSIAADNDTSLSELIILNPAIKNPNIIEEGTQVLVRNGGMIL